MKVVHRNRNSKTKRGGSAAAQCGKALPFRYVDVVRQAARLSLAAKEEGNSR